MEKNTALTAITDLRMEAEDLNSRTNRAVAAAVEIGASWTEVGNALGVSKQTAHARYGKKSVGQEIRESNAASKAAHAATEAEDKAALARYSKRRAEEEAAKIFDGDVAGDSKTPSIFSDAPAPAKDRTKPHASPFVHKQRQHSRIIEEPYDGMARPGTGNGPQLCIRCGSNNHHGADRGVIEWNDGCKPTKYDTAEETEFLNLVYKETNA